MSRPVDYGTHTIKAPKLQRMCQGPFHGTRPAVRKVNRRWKCQACLDGIAARDKAMAR